jgi:predicted transcriptional regulator
VLELSSQGLTQQDIANRLLISQKTVSNDLTWLKQDAVEFIKKNREHIAFEYKQVISNFYQLRKEAWNQFNSKETTAVTSVKISLYGIIESINNNIMSLLAAGDMIQLELLEKAELKKLLEYPNPIIQQGALEEYKKYLDRRKKKNSFHQS